MEREPVVFVGTSDLSGHFRGKSFAAADLPARLRRGVGISPTNLFLSAFGPIQFTPFGTPGEVLLIPDPGTRVHVPFEGGTAEHFYLGDLRELDGMPWAYCPRQVLRSALQRLENEFGLRLLASFEQEFTYSGVAPHPPQPYELGAYRQVGVFGEALLGALRQAGVIPEAFLSEFAPRQFEVTTAPAIGLKAADDAVITRELAQAVAYRLGHRVSFVPIPQPTAVGNGTHIHWSFLARNGDAAMYDAAGRWNLSQQGRQFIAGVLHHLPELCAITTPSVCSYYRLRPDRWAPVRSDVGDLDRGSALRICPLPRIEPAQLPRQLHVEFRVADATASPYLTLAMLVQAGLQGLRWQRDLDSHQPAPLPADLGQALDWIEHSELARDCLGAGLRAAYVKFKRAEIAGLAQLSEEEICRRYAEVY